MHFIRAFILCSWKLSSLFHSSLTETHYPPLCSYPSGNIQNGCNFFPRFKTSKAHHRFVHIFMSDTILSNCHSAAVYKKAVKTKNVLLVKGSASTTIPLISASNIVGWYNRKRYFQTDPCSYNGPLLSVMFVLVPEQKTFPRFFVLISISQCADWMLKFAQISNQKLKTIWYLLIRCFLLLPKYLFC